MITFYIKNCRVSVSFFFVAAAAALLVIDQSGLSLLTFLSAAFHEAGHFLAMSFIGVRLSQIRVTPFGMDIEKSQCVQRSYCRDLCVSLSGPLMNLIAGVVSATLNNADFANINFALAAFNLLPIEPLDGGQALYSLLCNRFSSDRSAKIVSVISFVTLLPLAVLGFLSVFRSPWNFSLLLTCVYLIFLLVFKSGRYY